MHGTPFGVVFVHWDELGVEEHLKSKTSPWPWVPLALQDHLCSGGWHLPAQTPL